MTHPAPQEPQGRNRIRAAWTVARIGLSLAAGLLAFLAWLRAVGPQIHVVESVLGLVILIGVAGALLVLTRRRGPPPG